MYSICEVIEDRTVNLGSIDKPEVVIGREPREGGMKLGVESISREHARFFKVEESIFFQDLESTNGSWVNGVKVEPGEIKYVSLGDFIQLADRRLVVVDQEGSITKEDETQSGIWVFKDSKCLGFKEVKQGVPTLVVGGKDAEYQLKEEVLPLPSLIIEEKEEGLVAYQRAMEVEVLIGKLALEGVFNLFHNDNVQIKDYNFVCISPNKQRPRANPVFTEVRTQDPDLSTILRAWDNAEDTKLLADRSKPSGGIFGRIDDTQAHEEQELVESLDIDTMQSAAYKKIEQRLVMMVFVVLVAAIFTMSLWWLLARG